MKILIADDHAVVRRGLKQLLADEFATLAAYEARNAEEALSLARQHEDWDLVVLDISMPDRTGLEVLKEIKQLRPHVPVLILTTHAEEQYALRVLKAGAAGYMTKESSPEHLIEAVRIVVGGERYISSTLTDFLADSLTVDIEKRPHENLSDREYQVLRLIASGKAVSRIAAELSLSVKTVSTYRTRVLEKLDLHTNAELANYALRNALIE